MYTVRGRTTATAATADLCIAALWNPHASHRIRVVQFAVSAAIAPGTGGTCLKLRRTNTEGSGWSSQITPGIANHSLRAVAPPSGARFNLGTFTGQPGLDAGDLGLGWVIGAVAGSGVIYPIPGGLEIPPGCGLGIMTGQAIVFPASDIVFVWLEDW